MKAKKILGFLSGMLLYAGIQFTLSGYMHLKTHPFLNEFMMNEFLKKASTKSFVKDGDKFKFYEFNFSGNSAPKLTGPALPPGQEFKVYYQEKHEIQADYIPLDWIKGGGWMEDEPWGPASVCHFYDPMAITGKKNLSDRATLIEWNFRYLVDYNSRDAKNWSTLSSNRYNWLDARQNVVNALKASTLTERNKFMALAYRSLGETLHLIADMGCPPHVRNDSHPPIMGLTYTLSFGDPDPYEDISGTIDPTSYISNNQPNSTFKSDVGNANMMETIFEKMSLLTNTRVPTNQTIATSKFKQIIRASNPYSFPNITEADYRPDQWAYVKNYDGREIILCKDKHPYTLLGSGNYRGQPYIDKECIASQFSMLAPNIVEAGANVIRLFVPALKLEITQAKTDSGGVVRGTVKYTAPSLDDEYFSLFDPKNIYNGPVTLFVNGTKIATQATAKAGYFEAKNLIGITLKKDDVVKAQIEFGGITLNSDTKKAEEKAASFTISLGSASMTLSPAAGTSGNIKVEHTGNKMIFTRTSGTITHTAEISWLTPPSGNLTVSEGTIFINQAITFKFSKTSVYGNGFFDGAEIFVNGVDNMSGWYSDWQQSSETSIGLFASSVEKSLPGSASSYSAQTTIDLPVVVSLNNTGGPESGIDGKLVFSGSVNNFWASGGNIQFSITYTYKD